MGKKHIKVFSIFLPLPLLVIVLLLLSGEQTSAFFGSRKESVKPKVAPPDKAQKRVEHVLSKGDRLAFDQLCAELRKEVKRLGWRDLKVCRKELDQYMRIKGFSVKKRPLVYYDFGDPNAENRTLIFSMVHSDEITPLYVGYKLLTWLKHEMPKLKSTRVVVAPFVNPDGFFVRPKTRTNANGVDLNRNFSTDDWNDRALAYWKRKYNSTPRKFPGKKSGSEPETKFQRQLIEEVQPQKILSIHAPLNVMDYDGPNVLTLSKFPKQYVKKCQQLRNRVKAVSKGFFPGSLGNFAGQERGIPTFTLELPTANSAKAKKYWREFREGIHTVVRFVVPPAVSDSSPQVAEKP